MSGEGGGDGGLSLPLLRTIGKVMASATPMITRAITMPIQIFFFFFFAASSSVILGYSRRA